MNNNNPTKPSPDYFWSPEDDVVIEAAAPINPRVGAPRLRNYPAKKRAAPAASNTVTLCGTKRRSSYAGRSSSLSAAQDPDEVREISAKIRRAILVLSPQQKRVVELHFEGMPFIDIAADLSLAPSTVRRYWYDSLVKMRTILEDAQE